MYTIQFSRSSHQIAAVLFNYYVVLLLISEFLAGEKIPQLPFLPDKL